MNSPATPLRRPASPERDSAGRYSGWRLFLEGLRGQRGWSRAWAKAAPRPRYRVVIVGGGGQGLATAYYLASEFGITDIAVVERGPIGLGNVGRNTTIIRSNYFRPENVRAIPADDVFAMRSELLAESMVADRAAGLVVERFAA